MPVCQYNLTFLCKPSKNLSHFLSMVSFELKLFVKIFAMDFNLQCQLLHATAKIRLGIRAGRKRNGSRKVDKEHSKQYIPVGLRKDAWQKKF